MWRVGGERLQVADLVDVKLLWCVFYTITEALCGSEAMVGQHKC